MCDEQTRAEALEALQGTTFFPYWLDAPQRPIGAQGKARRVTVAVTEAFHDLEPADVAGRDRGLEHVADGDFPGVGFDHLGGGAGRFGRTRGRGEVRGAGSSTSSASVTISGAASSGAVWFCCSC